MNEDQVQKCKEKIAALNRQVDFMWEQLVESGTCPNWLKDQLERIESGVEWINT